MAELSDSDLRDLITFAHRLADASGEVIRPHFRSDLTVDDKTGLGPGYDPVTVADREAESVIRELISKEFPDHGILGEEHGHDDGTSNLTWVIDPIDGTRAFITGVPLWGTLIALNDGTKPVLGIMDQPYTRERFVGSRFGAELDHDGSRRTISTRRCPQLKDAVVTSTHPNAFPTREEQQVFRDVADNARLSRFGGDCYMYCMIALGFVDVTIEAGLQPYDIQALIPIIDAAGGIVTTWDGGAPENGGQIIAAGDARVHQEVLKILAPAARKGPAAGA